MIDLLKYLNYNPPKIYPCEFENIKIVNDNGVYYLYIDGLQWMAYNTKTHEDAYSVFSHYDIAEGHVVVTGLGFGARENWLLTKNNISKLTVIEKNKSVINYHYKIQSDFLKNNKFEIVNCDALEYNYGCDVLLLDHYETESIFDILKNAKTIHDNVDCNKFWFWPFERIIMHSRKWHTDNDIPQKLYTKYEAFKLLKKNHNFYKMPDLDEGKINLYCMMHHSTVFSRSEQFLEKNCKDKKLFHNIYISV